MPENQPQIGYPSIDKPWLKWYRKEPVRHISTNQTIYELVFQTNSKNMKSVAIEVLESGELPG